MIERWSRERVSAWYDAQPWMLGFNYLPRTAVNWTELWQAATFDLATIAQELDWAKRSGFNALRAEGRPIVCSDSSFLALSIGLGDRTPFVMRSARNGSVGRTLAPCRHRQ